MDSDGTGFVFRNRFGGPRQMRDVHRAFREYTSETDEKGNTAIRDAVGNICEITTPDGQRIYAEPPHDLRERFVWKPGDLQVVPEEQHPNVDYVVRDEQGSLLEIALKDGTRIYAAPFEDDADA